MPEPESIRGVGEEMTTGQDRDGAHTRERGFGQTRNTSSLRSDMNRTRYDISGRRSRAWIRLWHPAKMS